jgi:hypothetical protein
MFDSPYGATGRNWFWRSWPNESAFDWDGARISSRDFKTKREATDFAARNGGGYIRKMRFCGERTTETRTDSIEIERA